MSAEAIARQFDIPGNFVEMKPITAGLMNDTYRVVFSELTFILQRINRHVFPDPVAVMHNMKQVTDHARRRIDARANRADRRWQIPQVIPSKSGELFLVDEEGETWRGLTLIADATCHETVTNQHLAREAGTVLGHFHHLISDLPAEQLADTLPGFHFTPGYLETYDSLPKETSTITDFIESRRDFASVLEDAAARGELQRRPTHGDPKITNIMIDDATGLGISMIDLDTVKPDLVHYDFGDCVRSCCNPLGEEVDDLDEVSIDLKFFEAVVTGYLQQAGHFLTEADHHYLYDSVRLLPFELGLRFYNDHLAGDVYFKTAYRGQNLKRAQVQFALCQNIEVNEGAMRRILGE